MNVDMDSIIIDINSTTSDSGRAIDTLIEKLNLLKDALSNVGRASNEFKTLSKNLSSGSSTVSSIRAKKTSTTPMPSLGEQTSQLGVKLDQKDVISSIKTVNSEFTKYKNELGQVVTVQRKMKDGMDQYKVSVKDTVKQTSAFEKFKNDIKSTVSNIAQVYFGLTRAWGIMGDLVETSSEYTEAVNLFYTEMGTKSREAEKWVKKFSDALYLDPKDVMQYMGAFNSLISGLGVGVDNSYKMSKNLTQLSYDLASYKNISFESAYDKLSSGIAGQIKGLRQVGVALSQNTLQELANEMGIRTRVKEMDEASKAQLRYIQIMRTSTNWQGDLGKTMMSTENILKSARQQWTLMARALGDLAAVIVRAVMPYFIALTQLIKEAAIALAKFLGFDINFSDRFKNSDIKSASTGIGKINDGIGNVGSSAKKAKKEINSMLAPFDDLNVVQNKIESAGSGGSGSGVGGSSIGDLDLPEYDALSKLTSEWSDKIAAAKQQIKRLLPVVKALAMALGAIWALAKIAKFIRNIKEVGSVFKGLYKAVSLVSSAFGISKWAALGKIGVILATIAYNIWLIHENSKILTKVFDNIKNSSDGLVGSIAKLSLGDKVKLILGLMAPFSRLYIVIRAIIEVINELKSGKSIGDIFQEWFPGISNFVKNSYNAIKNFITKTFDTITGIFRPVATWFNDHVITPIKNIISPIYKWVSELLTNIYKTLKSMIDVAVGLIKGTFNIIKRLFEVGKDWINNIFIKPIGKLFSSAWDTIKNGAKTAWNGIKSVFSPVAQFFGDIFSKAWKRVKDVFSVGGKIFDGIKSGITSAFKNIVNTLIRGINKVVAQPFNAINGLLNSIRGVEVLGIKPFAGLWSENPIFVPKIPTFEQGGYPDSGSLFWANENGIPEMIGQIGNKTAVANNDQITTAITNALVSALSGMNFGGRGTTVVNIGNKKVYEGIGEYINNENERYGTSYITI